MIDERAFADGNAAEASARATRRTIRTPTTESGAWCEPL